MDKINIPTMVVVYGTLRTGYYNNKYHLSDQKFLGEFKTKSKFTMFSFGGFPGLLDKGNTSIFCEVYQIDNLNTFNNLDRLEGYPEFYNRKKIDTPWGKAWIYYIEEASNEYSNGNYPLIKSGDWNEFNNVVEELINN